MEVKIERIIAAMERRIQALPSNLRPFTAAPREMPRCCVVTGQRGVGKTTFLLHHAKPFRMLYISADNPLLADIPLYEVVHQIFMTGYSGIMIDEVHFARDWSLHLKALNDDFPNHKIWVSDSSSLVLQEGAGDLSRRYVHIYVPPLSFREFIFLETGKAHPVFSPFEGVALNGTPDLLALFQLYKQYGTRPFYAEGNYQERLLGILQKTLYSDIPFFLPRITDGNLRLMNAVAGSLAHSPIPRLKVRSLCSDWKIGAEKLYQLLFVMESVGLLRIVRKMNDMRANTVGDKIFFGDPTYYAVLGGNIGTAREAMVAAMLAEAGWRIEAHKDETCGDFVVSYQEQKLSIEIGGAQKKRKKADFVIRDDTDVPAGNALPMWSLGFLY